MPVAKPAKCTGIEKFVPTIADHLQSNRYSRSQVEAVVRRQFDSLLTVIKSSPLFGIKAENREYADAIALLARKLQQKIEGAPEGTDTALFVAALYSRHLQDIRPEDINWHALGRYRKLFFSGLKAMQQGCAIVANPKNNMGDYHTPDRTKRHCASSAFELMVGLEAGRPASSGENSPLRIIANTFFEAVSPERVAERIELHRKKPDLRTQCEDVLKHWRARPEADLEQLCQVCRMTWHLQG
jgi:hypothetical protein